MKETTIRMRNWLYVLEYDFPILWKQPWTEFHSDDRMVCCVLLYQRISWHDQGAKQKTRYPLALFFICLSRYLPWLSYKFNCHYISSNYILMICNCTLLVFYHTYRMYLCVLMYVRNVHSSGQSIGFTLTSITYEKQAPLKNLTENNSAYESHW